MNVFFKKEMRPMVDYYGRVGGSREARVPTGLTKAVGIGLAVVGSGFLFADSKVDIMGDSATPISKATATEQIVGRYNRTFEAASPAGKFALQYLSETTITTPGDDGGNGFLGRVTGSADYVARFNDGCLSDTAYDIDGGKTEGVITGLFVEGHIEGSVPTAAANAYVDSSSPDTLVIASGHANSRDLRLDGLLEGDQLRPADQQTQDVLNTYGCESGMQHNVVREDGYAVTSDWVRQ